MKILAIGAHYDDIELNCLGTLLALKEKGDQLYLIVCTDGSVGGGSKIRRQEQSQVDKIIGYKQRISLNFAESNLTQNHKLVSTIEKYCNQIKPDLVITHCEEDFHQDHVAVARAVRAVNRYSKFWHWTFSSQDPKQLIQPNYYVDISDHFQSKLDILKLYKSQAQKPWFRKEVLESRCLGIGDAKYAERYIVKFMLL